MLRWTRAARGRLRRRGRAGRGGPSRARGRRRDRPGPGHAQGRREGGQGQRGRRPRVEDAREQGRRRPLPDPRSVRRRQPDRRELAPHRGRRHRREREGRPKRPLPADKLEAFVKDTKYAPSARRLAYELLVAQDPTAKDRLLPGFLNDKSPGPPPRRHRRRTRQAREGSPGRRSRPTWRSCSPSPATRTRSSCSPRSSRRTAAKVSVTEHFGFVTHWHLAGPFDSTDGQGVRPLAYPPETATDPPARSRARTAPR